MTKKKINKNLAFLYCNYQKIVDIGGLFILEGSSRSGKTWAIIYFLLQIMADAKYKDKKLTINSDKGKSL